MKIRKLAYIGSCLAAVTFLTTPANANVINAAPVGGYGTFQDTNTGRVWLDLNNFFNESYSQMAATANSLGFTVAMYGDVSQLLNSLPLVGGQWPTYASIMGSAPNRGLIWGGFDPGNGGTHGWAYSFDTDQNWTYILNSGHSDNSIENDGSAFADMNIWAFQTGTVPDGGSTVALLGFALAGVAVLRRKLRC
jgi:hypothetical protein